MKPVMDRVAILLLCAAFTVLAACASLPPPVANLRLLHDELFTLPNPPPDGQGVFAMSD